MGELPKVGIRPTIDGRLQGIRESLEEKTMRMARQVKSLIEKNLRHPSGEIVACVIAKSTIGGVAESAACEQYFEDEHVKVSLTVTPAWCYGTETIDMHVHRPKAIWGFNGTKRPGAVYLAAALAAHAQFGLPAFGIYGEHIQSLEDDTIPEDVAEKILRFVRAGIALSTMRGKSYLSIGSVSMGIAGSIIDPKMFKDYFDMRTEFVDMIEVKRRMDQNIYDADEHVYALNWVKNNLKMGPDYNNTPLKFSKDKMDSDLSDGVKMTMIIRDLMIGNPKLKALGFGEESMGHNALISGFQGQRAWTDFLPNGDFPETLLNSSFDWNGIRQPYVVATENDALNAISMLLGHLLTGTAQLFADVRSFWSAESVEKATGYRLQDHSSSGIIHLKNSGSAAMDFVGGLQKNSKEDPIKPFWKLENSDVHEYITNTQFCPANLEYFRGGGLSTKFCSKGNMPLTIFRINDTKGIGLTLQIAEGYSVELPLAVHETLDNRTDPAWPTTWFVPKLTDHHPFKSVYDVMNEWGSNHCAASYGHIGADLITLASMLRIPVSMHNIGQDRMMRPKSFGMFGTDSMESSDFRACGFYGPLYK
ncbi:MAG: L-fucose isomerase [Acholeplasmataceae bacterium]|nr:L-fucose isomerase [Acholeplasmataceae bacterium]